MTPSPGFIARIRKRFSMEHDPAQAEQYRRRLKTLRHELETKRH